MLGKVLWKGCGVTDRAMGQASAAGHDCGGADFSCGAVGEKILRATVGLHALVATQCALVG